MAEQVTFATRDALSKWDRRFIELAEHVAQWSKGPRKRIGAVIVRPDKSVASLGYNGAPRGYDDEKFLAMEREEQHAIVIHAEANALYQMAEEDHFKLSRSAPWRGKPWTLYVSPLFPCSDCARLIVASNIKRVVAYCGHISDDWRASAKEAENILKEARIECLFIKE